MNRTGAEAVGARLLAAIGGDAPLEGVVHLLAPDVICHMDRFTTRGADVWVDWVEFLRSRSVDRLNVEVERLETGADGIITAFGGLTTGSGGWSGPRGRRCKRRGVRRPDPRVRGEPVELRSSVRPQGTPSAALGARVGEDGSVASLFPPKRRAIKPQIRGRLI